MQDRAPSASGRGTAYHSHRVARRAVHLVVEAAAAACGSHRSRSHSRERLAHPRRARHEVLVALAAAARSALPRRCRRDRRRGARLRTRPRGAPRSASANPCRARARAPRRAGRATPSRPGRSPRRPRGSARRGGRRRRRRSRRRACSSPRSRPGARCGPAARRRRSRSARRPRSIRAAPSVAVSRSDCDAPQPSSTPARYRSATWPTDAPETHPNLPRRGLLGADVRGDRALRRCSAARSATASCARRARARPTVAEQLLEQVPGYHATRRRAT